MGNEQQRIVELEAAIQALSIHNNEVELLQFPWVGNLGNWCWMVESNHVICNDGKITALGYTRADVPEQFGHEFFTEKLHPDDYERVMDNMLQHLRGQRDAYEVEYRIRTKAGDYKWFYDRGKVTTWSEGKPAMLAGIVFDITQQKQLEQQLVEERNKVLEQKEQLLKINQLLLSSEQAFRSLYEQATDATAIIEDGFVMDCNEAFLQLLAYNHRSDVLEHRFSQLFYCSDLERIQFATIEQCGDKRQWQSEVILRNGETKIFDVLATKIDLSERSVCHVVIRDMTEKQQELHDLNYLSYHDPLTGLYNRRYIDEQLVTLGDELCAYIMADVNGLKLINDAFGHTMGDRYLMKVTELLRAVFPPDVTIARVGGDEFVVLWVNATEQEVAQAFDDALVRGPQFSEHELAASVSLGVAWKRAGQPFTPLLSQLAEEAMYRHKVRYSAPVRRKMLDVMIRTLYEKSRFEETHSLRVAHWAVRLGEELELSQEQLAELEMVGVLHDIGKVVIDGAILNKVEPLTGDEYSRIKSHAEVGYRILNASTEYSDLSKYVLHHHERWDGLGYPKGLKGEAIPLASRIIAIVDAFDTMTSAQTYRVPFSLDVAIEQLRDNAGKQFDPQLVERFLQLIK